MAPRCLRSPASPRTATTPYITTSTGITQSEPFTYVTGFSWKSPMTPPSSKNGTEKNPSREKRAP